MSEGVRVAIVSGVVALLVSVVSTLRAIAIKRAELCGAAQAADSASARATTATEKAQALESRLAAALAGSLSTKADLETD